MRLAAETLLGMPRFSYLEGRLVDHRNPLATRVHYALSSVEDAILTHLENGCSSIESLSFNTYMFDGAILYMKEPDMGRLNRAIRHVSDRWGVRFSVEKW